MSMEFRIPQVFPYLDDSEVLAVGKVIKTSWLTEGPKTSEFSSMLNKLINVKYGVFAPNGTLALVLGLMALGIKKGDEVLVPNTTFIASATAVLMLGANAIFVDVEPNTFQIDTTKAEKLITKKTKAIMPVHLYGTSCNMIAVKELALKYNLKIIEDAAQGIGVTYKNQHVGSFGDIGCFSFFVDKTITTGEGGYVVCNDESLYEELMYLRNQGRLDRGSFIHPNIGYNFRITDLQASIGIVQFSKLKEIIDKKCKNFALYKKYLSNLPNIRLLENEKDSNHIPFRCVLITEKAHDLMEYMSVNNVQTRSFFYPLHKQPCIQKYYNTSSELPKFLDKEYENSIYGYNNGLCLPIFPNLTEEQIQFICTLIQKFYSLHY